MALQVQGRKLWRWHLRTLPGAAIGTRVWVRPFNPEAKVGGLYYPDVAKQRPYAGVVIGAGDAASDILFDKGIRVGDEVFWAKFAGLEELWHHIVDDGKHDEIGCDCHENDDRWGARTMLDYEFWQWVCENCGAVRHQEPVILMDADDVLVSVELQERMDSGEVVRIKGVDPETGATRYKTVETIDTYSTPGKTNELKAVGDE